MLLHIYHSLLLLDLLQDMDGDGKALGVVNALREEASYSRGHQKCHGWKRSWGPLEATISRIVVLHCSLVYQCDYELAAAAAAAAAAGQPREPSMCFTRQKN